MPLRSTKLAVAPVYSDNHSDTGCGITIVIMGAVVLIIIFAYLFT